MNLLKKEVSEIGAENDLPIIVIGTGPVGMQFISSYLKQQPSSKVIVFGNEPWEPYNRVKLSSFFAGQVELDELALGRDLDVNRLVSHYNKAISRIDPETNTVVDALGQKFEYSKLVIATGSSANVPRVDGVSLKNIYTFRSMSDVEGLLARRSHSRKAAVVGGGVLGIEAAKAMTKQNTEVTIIDHSIHLMPSQLDETSSEMLREHLLSLGIKVLLSQGIKRFIGEDKVEKIQLVDGRELEFDTVILATGIKQNVELARDAHLNVGRGIRVNDVMQTSRENIYAVGECAEHRGKIYGIVKPGYEQAKVAANSLHGKTEKYIGSLGSTQIKVIDIDVFSMGDTEEVSIVGIKKEYVYQDQSKGIYRKLIIKTHGIVGAIAVGEWSELGRIQESINRKRFIPPWSLREFKKSGRLWPKQDSGNINEWPASTVVCQCTGVTRGQLSAEITENITLKELCTKTGASTVCGGCKPIVSQLLTGSAKVDPVVGTKTLTVLGFLTMLVMSLALLFPSIPYVESAEQVFQWDVIWRETLYKQISGFSLLALSLIALVMSLKKRIKKFKLFEYSHLRVMHIILGSLTVAGLALHSGYRLGEGLNFYLAITFIAVLIAGGISSLVVGLEHKMDVALAQKLKKNLIWIHIITFWPFPVLVAVHIFKSYYY